ncbi:MAG: tetratricopeptide repeat protein [Flavobacteriaceae bacterium]|jgi:tetratricopeptide (TPR) repeat protein|nr:tetratricopeptide repeat protein [Flavobacteriaceae bacterium]
MIKLFIPFFFFLIGAQCNGQSKQEQIVEKYLTNGAYRYHYTTQQWNDYIDAGIQQDSTIAVLWQNKALPYWKMRKYDLAIQCYDKVVQYNRKNYLSRRGYLKCIFQKDYKGAIVDLEMAQKEFGYNYENDHSYQFYIALCYLQLNQFEKAEQILLKDFERTTKNQGASWLHFLDLFYMGVIQYELRKYDTAITYLNKALAEYPKFSDAQYYKGLCLIQLKEQAKAEVIMREAKSNFEHGYTFTEDDAFYERYPYQVNWHMAKWLIPNYKEN